MTTRRLGLVSLVVVGLGFGTLAIASGVQSSGERVSRPLAVDPAAELPTPAYLELQKEAIPQPSGELADGALPPVPAIASPSR